jgi:RND superfamily putative drug exporter
MLHVRNVARWSFKHRYTVVAIWIVALFGLNAIKGAVGTSTSNNFRLPHTDSFDAVALLQRDAPKQSGDTEQIVINAKAGLTDPAVRAQVQALFAKVLRQPHVSSIASPYSARGASQIAPSGQIAFANVTFDQTPDKIGDSAGKAFTNVVTGASGKTVEFELEGQLAKAGSQNRSSSIGLPIGFLTALIVLFLVFGTLLAALLPLLTAGVALGAGTAVVGLISNVMSMADFSTELALLIGLGVGVDYALFIVTRYRQAMLRGISREDAVVEALDTSGRAVMFAGMIVCIAMLGMFALGVSFLYGVAVAASVVVAFTVVTALTLLPAMLSAFGNRTLRRKERKQIAGQQFAVSDESPLWARWTAMMAKQPALFAGGAALLMIVIALPFLSMRLGSADSGSDPSGTTTRKAYDLLAKGFGPGYNGPLQLVAAIDSAQQFKQFKHVYAAVRATPDVVGGTIPRFIAGHGGRPGVGLVNVYPKGSPQDASTSDLVDHLRATVVPAAERGSGLHVLISGNTAIFEDFAGVLTNKLPLFIGIVVALSFLLLMCVFRSVLIPATAALMNLLSTGAALGIVTAIFQLGWFGSLLGIDKTGPIEAFLPVLMFPILFGLSMDYEVFLVSRVYEEWHRRGDNREAVTHGLSATGRTITAAAAIMVLVFGAFVLGGERVIELFGIGLASAVLLDALIVRSVVVPGVMLLLGERNWWLPAAFDRVIPHLKVEGEARPGAPLHEPHGLVVPQPAPAGATD